MKTYKGNVEITKRNQKEWKKKLKDVTHISGNLYIYSDVEFSANKLESVGGYLSISSDVEFSANKLESVGGDLYINSKISLELEKRLWKHNKKNKWYLTQYCSDWLFKQKGNFEFRINDVKFDKELFDKVRKDKLKAKEVFAIENIEERRVAYEFMDKAKMKELKGYKILDKKKDKQGNIMSVVAFEIKGYNNPFKFLRCVCPSTKREYFLETKADTCERAKAKSFGEDKIRFEEEW